MTNQRIQRLMTNDESMQRFDTLRVGGAATGVADGDEEPGF